MREPHTGRYARLVSVAARRPRLTLTVAAGCTLLGIVGAARIKPEVSIRGMLSEDNASARALASIAENFATADELLVLAELPPGPAAPAADRRARLLSFAGRLRDALLSSAADAPVCSAVSYRSLPELARFVRDEMVPAGLLYLDDARFAALLRRLTPEGIREQLARNEELLATPGPAGSGVAKAILKDPLRLHEFLRPAGSASFSASLQPDALYSKDGNAILIRITGAKPVSNLEYAKALTQHVREVVRAVNSDALAVRYAGAYEIATTAERRIRADMIRSITWSVIALFVLFLLVYRRALAFPLAATPVAAGIIVAFGVCSLGSTHLTPIVAVIGALLAGLAIDFCIHFLSHYTQQRACGLTNADAIEETAGAVGPAMTAACVTSVVGFLAISQSSVRGLREFAVLGALGLVLAMIASFTVLPALLTVATGSAGRTAEPRLRGNLVESLLLRLAGKARAAIAASLCVAALCLLAAFSSAEGPLRFEADVAVMHPQPNAALDTQAEVADRFDLPSDPLLIHLTAGSAEQLVARAHQVDALLRARAPDDAPTFSTFGLASLLPDPSTMPRRLAEIAGIDVDAVIADFERALDGSIFDPQAYADYKDFLRRLLSVDGAAAPTIGTLRSYPELARLVLPRVSSTSGWQTVTLVHPAEPPAGRDARAITIENVRRAIAGVPGATLTGVPVLGYDTEMMIRHDLWRLLPAAAGVVLLWLVWFFRRAADTFLALLPALFGMSCLVGVMALFDVRLNTINLVGLPLLVGIGVDDGIFLVSLARQAKRDGNRERLLERLGTGCHAVFMTTATTLVTFGTLVFTSTPAIRSLGVVLGVGMVACLVGTLLLLVPILALRGRPAPVLRGSR